MLRSTPTLSLRTRVAYTPDPRITGRVVGHGTVHNAVDPAADGDNTYDVVIVRLDQPTNLGSVAGSNFHVPIVPSLLTTL